MNGYVRRQAELFRQDAARFDAAHPERAEDTMSSERAARRNAIEEEALRAMAEARRTCTSPAALEAARYAIYDARDAALAAEETAHYANPVYEQFVAECREAGLSPRHYMGRFFYRGPAVTVDDLQTAFRATTVDCQWDNLGKGYVVYPKG